MVDADLVSQVDDFVGDGALGTAQQGFHTTHGDTGHGKGEDLPVEFGPVLPADGFGLRRREVGIAFLALVARHRLAVVLGAAVALLAIEVGGWVPVVPAVRVRAVGPGVPHGLNVARNWVDLSVDR